MKSIKNYFANINVKTNTAKNTTPPPQQGRFVDKTSGFTIIEVALVLAIAGLIFLVVFLALPALQNSQKDTARKQDVGRVVSALQSYMADNSGSLSSLNTSSWVQIFSSDSSGIGPYIGKLGSEIGGVYSIYDSGGGSPKNASVKSDHIEIYLAVGCDDVSSSAPSDAAVTVWLSSGTLYCASM